jgi:hypothetical protein
MAEVEPILSYAREHPTEVRAFLAVARRLAAAYQADPAILDRLGGRWRALTLARETIDRGLGEIRAGRVGRWPEAKVGAGNGL